MNKEIIKTIEEFKEFYRNAQKKRPVSGNEKLSFAPALFSEADICFHFARILGEKLPKCKDWIHIEFPFNKRRLGNYYCKEAKTIDICVVNPQKLSEVLSEKCPRWEPGFAPFAIEVKMCRVNETLFKKGNKLNSRHPFVKKIEKDINRLNKMVGKYIGKAIMLIVNDREEPKLSSLEKRKRWEKYDKVDIHIIERETGRG